VAFQDSAAVLLAHSVCEEAKVRKMDWKDDYIAARSIIDSNLEELPTLIRKKQWDAIEVAGHDIENAACTLKHMEPFDPAKEYD